MGSVALWAAEEGYKIEPYGLDLIDSLAALARNRLPHWAGHLFIGNVLDWRPPFRFDFVRTELEYAPPSHRRKMVERVLHEYLVPGGRLIVCSYGSSRHPALKAGHIGEILRDWCYSVAGEAEGVDTNGVVFTRVAWTDLPEA